MRAPILRCVLLVLSILLITGCVSAPADPSAIPMGVNRQMLTAPVVKLWVSTINDAAPPDGVIDTVVARLQPYMKGNIVVTVLDGKTLPMPPNGFPSMRVSSDDIPPSRSDVMLLFLPMATFGRGLFTLHDNDWQQIQFNAAHIEQIAGPFLSKRTAWELVMTHELGHALGIPASKEHMWSHFHCTAPHCVMYPKVDARSILAAVVRLGPPTSFCADCDSELRDGTK